MKDYTKLPNAIIAIAVLVMIFNVTAVLFVPKEIFAEYDSVENYISIFYTLIVFSSLQLFLSHVFIRTACDTCARFTLDSLPGKQMGIDAELNAGTITQEDAENQRKNLQETMNFFGYLDGCCNIFAIIDRVITCCAFGVVIMLSALNQFDIVSIDPKYVMILMVAGILSQVVLFFTAMWACNFAIKKVNNI